MRMYVDDITSKYHTSSIHRLARSAGGALHFPCGLLYVQGDPSGWLKRPVVLVPTVLAAGGLLLLLPTKVIPSNFATYLLPRQDGETAQIKANERF